MATHLAFPYRIDARGRTAAADIDAHVRGLIEQLLLTAPGERVHRPDFGSGLRQMVFSPNSPEVAATLQFTVQAALERYLGARIETQAVEVEADEATLRVHVRYRRRPSGSDAAVTVEVGN